MAYLAQYNYDIAESVLQAALIALPEIEHSPNYKYLSKSLNEHLYQARLRQALPVTR